jgi:hypothetical protein
VNGARRKATITSDGSPGELVDATSYLKPSSAAYWFLMQIGMIVGFFTSWPANVWLVNRWRLRFVQPDPESREASSGSSRS